MPLLTVLGTIGIPVGQGGSAVPVQMDASAPVGELRKVSVGLIGVVPDLTTPFIEGGSLSVRSEVLEIRGWFSVGGDPFYDSGYTDDWTGEMVLDENIMKDHDLVEGSVVYILDEGGAPCSSFRVVSPLGTSLTGGGIIGDLVGGAAIVHLGELQYATGNHIVNTSSGIQRDLATAIYLKVTEDAKAPSSLRDLSARLSTVFQGHMVSTEEGRLYRLQEEVLVLEVFAVSVGTSAFLVGMMFLSSIMLIEQEEKRSEIALMRAIGASRASIYRGMLAESMVLALVGAMMGAIPGIIGSRYLDSYLRAVYGIDVVFSDPTAYVIGASFAFLILNVIVFSSIPGMYIMRMEIRSALGGNAPR
jgi:hypothetical protein